jgi:hypothetical protein
LHLFVQAVESVLAECGQDIDAAIRRLTELKLSTAEQQQQQAQAQASMAAANQQHDTASVADSAQQQQQQVPSGPQTAEQWVDSLVQEMAAAKDFTDARGCAAKMLQAFEQFVSARSKEVSTVAPCRHVFHMREQVVFILAYALRWLLAAIGDMCGVWC